jgi:uncharacterized membrane protein
MVALSALVFLPTSAIAAFGVAVTVFHNLFDDVRGENLGRFGSVWYLLHQPNHGQWWPERLPGYLFATPYPVLPWLGTMAAGYGLGAMLLLERSQRRKQLLGLGLALVMLFVVLRLANRYGDPQPYTEPPDRSVRVFSSVELTAEQSKPLLRLMAFLNCTKYPPSLLFLLMTLGPSITALALFDRPIGSLGRPFVIFGRVPLFYYLLHISLIHGLAVALDYWRFGWSPLQAKAYFQLRPEELPLNYGFDLQVVYAIWAGVIVFLFPLCSGFARLKRRYPVGILSYL